MEKTNKPEMGFPKTKPNVKTDNAGWLSNASKTLLSQALTEETIVVFELGSWLGLSARFIYEHAPNATIFCIDHWQGSREHQHPKHKHKLANLWDTFAATNYHLRDRIVPVRASTTDGIQFLHSLGIVPDVIYIDASHEYEYVRCDILNCNDLFPKSKIIGDDWRWQGVQKAAIECAELIGCRLHVEGGKSWSYIK